jgi:hypothetical protein
LSEPTPVQTAGDPFADSPKLTKTTSLSASEAKAAKTRTVKFIRNGKEQEVTVTVDDDAAAAGGASSSPGYTATTSDPADVESDNK